MVGLEFRVQLCATYASLKLGYQSLGLQCIGQEKRFRAWGGLGAVVDGFKDLVVCLVTWVEVFNFWNFAFP